MQLTTTDPTTEDDIETYEYHDDADLDRMLDASADRFASWRDRLITERQALVGSIADVLRENEDEYAELMTEEMGKPVSQARGEIQKCAWVCEFYAERAAEFLQDERVGVHPEARTKVSYEPLGPLVAVMPWNYPFWQVLRVAAPTLAAGNTMLLSHAPNVTGCATAVERILADAGFPEGVFQTLVVDTDAIHDAVADDRVAAATLTGSVRAGRAVAETAGNNLKPSVLELGGSDPFVVLDDAHLDRACEVAAQARVNNNGQACIAAKRFIVHEDVYEEFRDGLVREMESLTVGDPREENTDVGPIARADLLDTLETQVKETVDAGATVLTGGEALDREGYFFEPTVLEEIPEESPAACDELFGPVASLFRVGSEEEAMELANDTDYGLGASVWTGDLERGERLAGEFEAGAAFVNELVQSHPKLPFGGVKNSGYGRELAADGIREFTNKKTVWVSPADGLDD
ncbi:NAD-dependent succinate-semialdehyde dehydrogenase [Halogeometricum luteum]|uniref:NAD-dependent succinate-semialdehyde dehydrogenase n=1 Tax=Halogeometricum luteum TaxID=2950537 RepID=A0ABU2G4A4_9EURY|nr:NAD-dependent succinate-semialdehyde dehydrogenase [Halogeometricum sp. S3BR5-2]MDS0295044.1 NAD-dependent succinate-semialdehyde dehydrogenase [Halogeometricum sp. S3BR5-2]